MMIDEAEQVWGLLSCELHFLVAARSQSIDVGRPEMEGMVAQMVR